MNDAGIVRNRAKIEATIANARAFLAVRREHRTFDRYVWQFVGGRPVQNAWRRLGQCPAETDASARHEPGSHEPGASGSWGRRSADAFMQATGMVNDHTRDCFRWREIRRRAKVVGEREAVRMSPARRVRLAAVGDVAVGEGRVVEAQRRSWRCSTSTAPTTSSTTCALTRGGPLGEGRARWPDRELSRHDWRWDVTTGANANNPAVKMARFRSPSSRALIFVDLLWRPASVESVRCWPWRSPSRPVSARVRIGHVPALSPLWPHRAARVSQGWRRCGACGRAVSVEDCESDEDST